MADETLKEANLKRSIKKFFWDNIYTTESIQVHFDRAFVDPGSGTNQWITVRCKDLQLGQISMASLIVHLFTKNDLEGDQIAALRDIISDYLQERIDLYNSSWEIIGGMKLYPTPDSEIIYLPDNGKMKTMMYDLRWGAIY